MQLIQLSNLLSFLGRVTRCRYMASAALLFIALLLANCSQPPVQQTEPEIKVVAVPVSKPIIQPQTNGYLIDFGETHLKPFADKLRSMDQKSHIVQLGDSHTAGDFFTGALRTAFQQRFGNAGPGWLPPASIRGQRSGALKLGEIASDEWQLTTSRVEKHPNFPPGGFLLQPLHSGSRLQLAQYTPDNTIFSVRALYQSPHRVPMYINGEYIAWDASEHWQWSAAQRLQLPLELEVLDQTYPLLGGWLVENDQPGVLLSSLGINGATFNMVDKWGENWQAPLQALQPGMLIVAYGTNEAFYDNLDNDNYYANLTRHIKELREQQPQATVLILGAPDVIKNSTADNCQTQRPIQLDNVQAIQRKVAREQRTLFWDWQAMMGGICGFSDWQTKGLARKDGVHFTNDGYKASANALFQDLMILLEKQ